MPDASQLLLVTKQLHTQILSPLASILAQSQASVKFLWGFENLYVYITRQNGCN